MGPRGRCQWERGVEWRRTGSRCRRDTIKKSSSHAFVRRQPAHELSRFPHTRRFLEKLSLSLSHCHTTIPPSVYHPFSNPLSYFVLPSFFFALSSISTTINMYKYIYIYVCRVSPRDFQKGWFENDISLLLFSSPLLKETRRNIYVMYTEMLFSRRVEGWKFGARRAKEDSLYWFILSE